MRLRTVLALVGAALLAAPAAASAHIQVNPKVVAPNDAVKFTVLVPGERSDQTVKVDLKLPSGLLPFSYEDTPGWTRQLVKASNGGVDRIVWSGRLPRDGFAEFSFLAGTPEQPGELQFKALQTYSGGTVVRWIGAPSSDNPAPVVKVEKGAAAQNAGGESSTTVGTAAPVVTAAPVKAADGPSTTLPIILSAAALIVALLPTWLRYRPGARRRARQST